MIDKLIGPVWNSIEKIVPVSVLALFLLACQRNSVDESRAEHRGAPGSNRPASGPTDLKIVLIPQEVGNWCWAASSQMIMAYLGAEIKQCSQANNEFGRTDCCVPSGTIVPDVCNLGGWPEFEKYGFTNQRTSNTALSWAELKTEINNNRPVAFSWGWSRSSGEGHMMVAVGFIDDDTGQRVIVNDPLPLGTGKRRIMPYQAYVSADDHTHWDDFYSIKRGVK